MNSNNRKIVQFAATILLLSFFCVSCYGSRKTSKKASEPTQKSDSTEQFTPLHPPVVIPHDWREELQL